MIGPGDAPGRGRCALLALGLTVALAAPAASRAQGLTEPGCFPFAPGCASLPRLLEDLAEGLAPVLDDLAGRIDPVLEEVQGLLGDLSGWEAPEILPGGDILIRRRRPGAGGPAPQPVPEDSADSPVTVPLEL